MIYVYEMKRRKGNGYVTQTYELNRVDYMILESLYSGKCKDRFHGMTITEISDDYDGTLGKRTTVWKKMQKLVSNGYLSERLEMLKDGGMMVISLMGAKDNQTLDYTLLLQKLTKDGIFAPIESNKICENIAIIHAGRNNADIEKDSIIAEVGKPKNVFEGYNGRSTLVAVSGLDYPVSHVAKLGEIAKAAYEERQRDRKHVSKLGSLDFTEETESKVVPEKKVSSKLAGMRKKMQEMNK